jgi:hypothetical protein
MKLKHLILAAIVAFLPFEVMADGRELATKNFRELNVLAPASVSASDYIPIFDTSAREVKKILASSIPTGGQYDTSSIAFSGTLTGNPLLKVRYTQVSLASANAGIAILASATGKTIHATGGWTIMASGTSAGGTSLILKCSGGRNLATIPVALLVDQIPTGPFASTVVTKGAGLTQPCGSGEALMLSAVGTMTTTSNYFLNIPYTVQ